MKHNEIKILLEDYIKGKLNNKDKNIITKHIAECKSCSKEVEFLKLYFKKMHDSKKEKAPNNLYNQIKLKINSKNKTKKLISKVFYPIEIKLPVTAISIVIIIIFISIISIFPFKKLFWKNEMKNNLTLNYSVKEEKIYNNNPEMHSRKENITTDKIINSNDKKGEAYDEITMTETKVNRQLPMAADEKKSVDKEKIYQIALLINNKLIERSLEEKKISKEKDKALSRASIEKSDSIYLKEEEAKSADQKGIGREQEILDLIKALKINIIKYETDNSAKKLKSVLIETDTDGYNQLINSFKDNNYSNISLPEIKDNNSYFKVEIRINYNDN